MSTDLPEVEPPEVDAEALAELNRERQEAWLRWLRIGVPGCWSSPGHGMAMEAEPYHHPSPSA